MERGEALQPRKPQTRTKKYAEVVCFCTARILKNSCFFGDNLDSRFFGMGKPWASIKIKGQERVRVVRVCSSPSGSSRETLGRS